MDSYLKGRKQTQRFRVNLPPPKPKLPQDDATAEIEETVPAEPMPGVDPQAPDVDLVLRDGVVQKIIVHLPDGQRLELDCVYGDEE